MSRTFCRPPGSGVPRGRDLAVWLAPENVTSFTTIIFVFVKTGMAKLTRCCRDSGFQSYGNRSCINPSIVEKLGFQPYRIDRQIDLADGSTTQIRWEVEAHLSFQVPSGLITIPVMFEVRPKDSPCDSMILNTGVLHSLGGLQDHRTNLSIFQVTDPVSGELVPLHGEDPDAKLEFDWFPKQHEPLEYINEVINSPAFLKRGQRDSLPTVAFHNACSKVLREVIKANTDWMTIGIILKLRRWAKEVEITEAYQSWVKVPRELTPEEVYSRAQAIFTLIHSSTPSIMWPPGEWTRRQQEAHWRDRAEQRLGGPTFLEEMQQMRSEERKQEQEHVEQNHEEQQPQPHRRKQI